MHFLLALPDASRYLFHVPAAIITRTDANNESESFGWSQDSDGTWTALTLTGSKSGFKTERGARAWFMRNATDRQLAALGIA